MQYMPHVRSMNRIAGAPLDDRHMILLFDNIESIGAVKYAYLVIVFETASKQPVLFVASEVNSMAEALGGGSHFLGVFEESGHVNMGSSDDWGDPGKFFPRAMQIAKDRFSGTPPSAAPVPDGGPDGG